MTTTPEGQQHPAGATDPQRPEATAPAAPTAPITTPAQAAAAPQDAATERLELGADRDAATLAVPQAVTEPAAPAAPVAPQAAAPQEQPTQRIAPAPTQTFPQAAMPQAAPQQPAPTQAYPAPYQHGAPPQPAPAAPPQPRYGQLAPQQPVAPQHQAAPYPAQQHPAGPQPTGQQPAAPYAQAPQQQHDPLAAFRTPAAGGAGLPPVDGEHPAGSESAPGAPRRDRNRIWLPVVGVGVAAALLGGLGGAGVVAALSDGSGSSSRAADVSSIGRTENEAVPVSGSSSENPDWQAVAAAVRNSVVSIQVTTSSGEAQGSGVVVDEAGHVLTNNHVVSGAQDDQVQVTLSDGRIFTADVVGTDPTTDLAVVKLQDAPDDLTPAAFGDSDDVSVGDPVMAVGNPLGLANTATTGIVSAIDRPVSTTDESGSEAVVTNALQIDAAINPGNSGGPLFDAQGRVIGITSSIATTSSESGSIGLGFAIPVNVADLIAGQLIADGTAEHAFLGVSLSDGTATADGVTRAGAQVESVSDGSPAADAGLQKGDVIVAIDGNAVAGAESLTGFVRAHATGDQVTLTVVRDGSATDVDVTLATREETTTDSGSGSGSGSGDQGSQGDGSQQAPDQGGQSGQGGLENMTPEQLWEWFQQQQQGQ